MLTIEQPAARAIFQRQGYNPIPSLRPERGYADIEIRLNLSAALRSDAWIRVQIIPCDPTAEIITVRRVMPAAGRHCITVRVPAGWHRLSAGAGDGTRLLARTPTRLFGVGEVFLIAGQSYADGCNDERLSIQDPRQRVSAYDLTRRRWQAADDPQPGIRDGGTIWPAMADDLLPYLQVPVGWANVAVAATASRQWMPGTTRFERMAGAGSALHQFRAVLWQQGESDVIEQTPADRYVQNLTTIRQALHGRWGFSPAWIPAKSTLHPTVYNNLAGESIIRSAIDRLWRTPGFLPGPDTDLLDGENRGGQQSLRHFSPIGQRRAGRMWAMTLWNHLQNARW